MCRRPRLSFLYWLLLLYRFYNITDKNLRIFVESLLIDCPPGKQSLTSASSTYLVLNNRMVAVIVAAAMLLWRGEGLRNVAPIYTYAGVSVSNVLATWAQARCTHLSDLLLVFISRSTKL